MLSREYFCVVGSHHIMSPVEKPRTRSRCDVDFVTWLTSWHIQWAFVKRILVKYSFCASQQPRLPPTHGTDGQTLFGDDMSSHWKDRLTFANAKIPSFGRSCSLLTSVSVPIVLEINDELLLVMLLFGFRFFDASLGGGPGASRALPSPNAGLLDPSVAVVGGASLVDVPRPSSLLSAPSSWEKRLSLGCSAILSAAPARDRFAAEPWKKRGDCRVSRLARESLQPAVAG